MELFICFKKGQGDLHTLKPLLEMNRFHGLSNSNCQVLFSAFVPGGFKNPIPVPFLAFFFFEAPA